MRLCTQPISAGVLVGSRKPAAWAPTVLLVVPLCCLRCPIWRPVFLTPPPLTALTRMALLYIAFESAYAILLKSDVFFSLQSLCLMHTGKPMGVAVSHCITWFQTELILTTYQIHYHSHLWDHRSTGQL